MHRFPWCCNCMHQDYSCSHMRFLSTRSFHAVVRIFCYILSYMQFTWNFASPCDTITKTWPQSPYKVATKIFKHKPIIQKMCGVKLLQATERINWVHKLIYQLSNNIVWYTRDTFCLYKGECLWFKKTISQKKSWSVIWNKRHVILCKIHKYICNVENLFVSTVVVRHNRACATIFLRRQLTVRRYQHGTTSVHCQFFPDALNLFPWCIVELDSWN